MWCSMKFLIDVGVGKKVENWLRENGYDVLAVRDIDAHAKDSYCSGPLKRNG